MPIIAVFYGIVIRMFYYDHGPAHFHAEYQGEHGKFDLDGRMVAGTIRSRAALRRIREWASLHRVELSANWDNVRRGVSLDRIEPLE